MLLKFDGNGVNCGRNPAFNTADAMTVTAWIKVQTSEQDIAYHTIIDKGRACWRLIWAKQTDALAFEGSGLDVPSDAPYSGVRGKRNVSDGGWHHAAGVYDGDFLLLYVDGILDATANASGTIHSNVMDLWIGKESGSSQWYGNWSGLIDDVRIYNRALSADEIIELYNDTK